MRLGVGSQCFQGSAPAKIVGQVFGGDALEATHPSFESAVTSIDVVDVKIGSVRAWFTWRRQNVSRDGGLSGEGNDGRTAADLLARLRSAQV